MPQENTVSEHETLGALLHKTRLARGLEIEQVTSDTRISAHIIIAMENDDYAAMPAPAFTHGFYGLYAKKLGLDPQPIQQKYQEALGMTSKEQLLSPTPVPKKAPNLAERPPIPVLSIVSFALLLTFIVFGVLSWFFSWNPADFLSKQLREFDKGQQVEQKITETSVASQTQQIVSDVTPATLAKTQANPPAKGYTLQGTFDQETTIIVTLDEGVSQAITVETGETRSWHALQSITIFIPSPEHVSLTLNDNVPITLPAGQNVTISIPEYFFE